MHVTIGAWYPESRRCRVTGILTGATVWTVFYANAVSGIMNSMIFSLFWEFQWWRTPGFLRKPLTEKLKKFFSFTIWTLSCVQLSSLHCFWCLREEQTARYFHRGLFFPPQENTGLFVQERTRQCFHISHFLSMLSEEDQFSLGKNFLVYLSPSSFTGLPSAGERSSEARHYHCPGKAARGMPRDQFNRKATILIIVLCIIAMCSAMASASQLHARKWSISYAFL